MPRPLADVVHGRLAYLEQYPRLCVAAVEEQRRVGLSYAQGLQRLQEAECRQQLSSVPDAQTPWAWIGSSFVGGVVAALVINWVR